VPIDENGKSRKLFSPAFLEKVAGPVVVAAILGVVGFGVNSWRAIDSFEHSLGEHERVHLQRYADYRGFKKTVSDFMAGSGNRFTDIEAKELKSDILTSLRLEMRLLEASLAQRIADVQAGVPPKEVRDALTQLRREQDRLSWQVKRMSENK